MMDNALVHQSMSVYYLVGWMENAGSEICFKFDHFLFFSHFLWGGGGAASQWLCTQDTTLLPCGQEKDSGKIADTVTLLGA